LKFANKTWSNSLRPQKLMVVNKKLRKMWVQPFFFTFHVVLQYSFDWLRTGWPRGRSSSPFRVKN
jgi:hypothetical protein